MKEYTSIWSVLTPVTAFVAFALFSAVGIMPLIYALFVEGVFHPELLCFGLFFTLWAGLITWMVGNQCPIVWVSAEGLFISHNLLWRIQIPWDEIEEIKRPFLAWGGVLVIARRITPLHRLYGWQWGHTTRPGFLIHPRMQGREELVREIQRRAGIW